MDPVTREELHKMVDALPAEELELAKRELTRLCIPYDDEPETPAEAAAVAQARAELARGEGIPAEDVWRELGLCDGSS